jgi:hypothetical protein
MSIKVGQHAFLDFGVDRSIVDQRSTGVLDEREAVEMPGPEFGDLADASGDRRLMTFGAGLRVVDRSEPFRNVVAFLEVAARDVERGLVDEAIREVAESDGSFGASASNPRRVHTNQPETHECRGQHSKRLAHHTPTFTLGG